MRKQEIKKEAYVNRAPRMRSHNTLPHITEKRKIVRKKLIYSAFELISLVSFCLLYIHRWSKARNQHMH